MFNSEKLKPLQIGPYKIFDRPSDVAYELRSQDGSTVHIHRKHLFPYYPKEPLLYPHLRSFSDTTQFYIPKQMTITVILLLLIQMNPYQTNILLKHL